jgi:putative transferase (TIGR04331 family)
LDDQFTFVETLPEVIRNELTVRLYPIDYGWGQKARWNEKYPNIKLDPGNKNIKHQITNNRIIISTYNATTFLESFAMNIPTVMFWNPNHWELRDPVKPYFTALKEVGVFHETPESAAIHISEIWDNVDNWWTSDSVSKAVSNFCENYNKTNKNLVETIHKELIALRNFDTN